MKPNTHNLTSWVKGNNLNVFQKSDAIIEYDNLLQYVSKLEKALNIIKNFDEDGDSSKYESSPYFDKDKALKILKASQNSIIISDKNILSYDHENTSFEDLAK